MNYISILNHFWAVNRENPLGANAIALYLYLVNVNNSCQWRCDFRRNNALIMAELGIKDRRTLDTSRNKLKQVGLIDFEKNTTNPNVTYALTCAKNAQVHVQDDVQDDDTKDKYKYKQNKDIFIEKIKKEIEISDEKKIAENSENEIQILIENLEKEKSSAKKEKETIRLFLENPEKQQELATAIAQKKGNSPDFYSSELKKFVLYWTEKSASGWERWEGEKYFELNRRIMTWLNNAEKFAQKFSQKTAPPENKWGSI